MISSSPWVWDPPFYFLMLHLLHVSLSPHLCGAARCSTYLFKLVHWGELSSRIVFPSSSCSSHPTKRRAYTDCQLFAFTQCSVRYDDLCNSGKISIGGVASSNAMQHLYMCSVVFFWPVDSSSYVNRISHWLINSLRNIRGRWPTAFSQYPFTPFSVQNFKM